MYNRYTIDNTKFKIAVYIRLSREDGDDLESESVVNQRSLLICYLKAQWLVAVDIYAAGYGSSQIVEVLTREEIPTPVMYKCSSSKLSKFDYPEIWKHTSVSNIIKNRVYTGDLIQHGFQKVSYKVKKRKSLPESKWCIKENDMKHW